jgi:2-oxoglutarate dehydrogenase E1 component
VMHDQNREKWDHGIYVPLKRVRDGQAALHIYDSVLSEEAVLGFEYGYSTTEPEHLVVWEAQFGDFANGAQVVIDQFISSGEAKWGRQSSLVMLLPHGYEGQGPEHSSARPERYMQLCAEMNMEVAMPTTPAQIFHLLRHKDATSPLEELANGTFQTVIGEVDELEAKKVKRVVVCSGKVYYDLLAHRRANNIKDTAVVRLEQLYPFPAEAFAAEVAKYPNAKEIVWTQEEPRNQGMWYWLISRQHLDNVVSKRKLLLVARPAAASPAVGYYSKHNAQQKAVVENAFGEIKD